MDKIHIKTITKKEFDKFFELFVKLLKTQFPEYSKKTIEWMISNPRAFNRERMSRVTGDGSRLVLGAFSNNVLIGFIYGEPPFGGVSQVFWLAVAPVFQLKGVGRTLLKKWEEIVKDLGAHAIHLNATPRNLEFYKKLGYEVIGFDKKSYFGIEDYILKKIIQEPEEENYLK